MRHRLNDVKRVVLWGKPVRHQGIRADDGYLPIAKPGTAGILEDRLEGLEHAPFQIRDYGHADEMYASVGLNDMAEDERAICKFFMGHNVLCGPGSILTQIFGMVAYLRQVVTQPPLRCSSLLDALFARVTIAETLKVDRMIIRRWLGSRDSRDSGTPAISGAKPE